MSQEHFDLKKESINLLILFVISIVLFKILFYKESLVIILRTVFSLFWVFVLPGFSIMLYWRDNMDFLERLLLGIALSAAVIGVSSYYLGLAGLNIKYHTVLLPLVLLAIGLFSNRELFKELNKDKTNQ